jgi:hypothetical protein
MYRVSIFPQGTRVRVRRGRFPMKESLIGREGLVVRHDPIVRHQVVVQLDGESELRNFTDDELEALDQVVDVQELGSPGPGLSSTGS